MKKGHWFRSLSKEFLSRESDICQYRSGSENWGCSGGSSVREKAVGGEAQ